jgi:hypothetical protein
MAPPPNTMVRLLAIFTRMMRTLRKRQDASRFFSVATSMAAISWGMPLPPAKGARRRTNPHATRKLMGAVRKMSRRS